MVQELLSGELDSLHVLPLSLSLEQRVHERTGYIAISIRRKNY